MITFLDNEGKRHQHSRVWDPSPDYRDVTRVAISTDVECYESHRNRGPTSRLERLLSSADPILWSELCSAWSQMEAQLLHCHAWDVPISSVPPIIVHRANKNYVFRTDILADNFPDCYETNSLSETIDRVCVADPVEPEGEPVHPCEECFGVHPDRVEDCGVDFH